MNDEQKARLDAALNGWTMEVEHIPTTAEKVSDLTIRFNVTLSKYGREVVKSEYGMGIGHLPSYPKSFGHRLTVDEAAAIRTECRTGRDRFGRPILPELANVLYALVSDADAIDHPTFESWADNYGYDPDSRKAEATYRACLEIGLKLRAALGDAGLAELREAFQDY